MKALTRLWLGGILTFGLFTTFVPCKYSSRGAVANFLVTRVFAQGGGSSGAGGVDCDCNQWWEGSRSCSMAYPCNAYTGCGPFWLLSCNGLEGDPPPNQE